MDRLLELYHYELEKATSIPEVLAIFRSFKKITADILIKKFAASERGISSWLQVSNTTVNKWRKEASK